MMPGRITALAAAVLLLLAGCSDDSARPRPKHTESSPYKDLSQKWHVLYNVELSYNEMNAERYIEVLDENFIALFYSGDVGGGVPEWWPRSDEEASAREMLNRGGGRDNNPVVSIDLTLGSIEEAVWVEVTPDQDEFPGETWYATVVGYRFRIETTKGFAFVSNGHPAVEFQVRAQDDGTWRAVRWRDLGSETFAAAPAGIEPVTWGKVKAGY
jgi:hypothetical protein